MSLLSFVTEKLMDNNDLRQQAFGQIANMMKKANLEYVIIRVVPETGDADISMCHPGEATVTFNPIEKTETKNIDNGNTTDSSDGE